MKHKGSFILAAALVGSGFAGVANAAPQERAIEACKVAIAESVNQEEVNARLKRVKSRGNSYEVWLNVRSTDTPQRSYCLLRSGEVEQLVMQDGRWSGTRPRRPDTVEVG